MWTLGRPDSKMFISKHQNMATKMVEQDIIFKRYIHINCIVVDYKPTYIRYIACPELYILFPGTRVYSYPARNPHASLLPRVCIAPFLKIFAFYMQRSMHLDSTVAYALKNKLLTVTSRITDPGQSLVTHTKVFNIIPHDRMAILFICSRSRSLE
jgi:hypothetical protein